MLLYMWVAYIHASLLFVRHNLLSGKCIGEGKGSRLAGQTTLGQSHLPVAMLVGEFKASIDCKHFGLDLDPLTNH